MTNVLLFLCATRAWTGPPCRPLLVERPDSPMLYSRTHPGVIFACNTDAISALDLRVGPIQKLEKALFSMSKATPHAKTARTPGGAASKGGDRPVSRAPPALSPTRSGAPADLGTEFLALAPISLTQNSVIARDVQRRSGISRSPPRSPEHQLERRRRLMSRIIGTVIVALFPLALYRSPAS
jgi:hypothetical protein